MITDNSTETLELIDRVRAGDVDALNALFTRHMKRLRRMVDIRMDRRLQARIDASDVLQEAHLEVIQRLDEYLSSPKHPLFLWLRLVVGQRLMAWHRQPLFANHGISPVAAK